MATTTFDITDEPSDEQKAAEASALEQGEKIAQLQQEERDRKWEQQESENESAELIGGKFKTQDDLLKAYEELQKKLSNPEATDEGEEPEVDSTEERVEEEVEQPEQSETVKYMQDLGREFEEKGELSADAIERLGSMDSKELIQAYLAYNSQAQAATLQQSQINDIYSSVGGQEAYTELVTWAASNLSETEISEFNQVTASNNPAAIKFAARALQSRYKEGNGSEAELITRGKRAPQVQGYRSHAELARDIGDPRYANDPAFSADVEAKVARSADLL